jgi:SanA protein
MFVNADVIIVLGFPVLSNGLPSVILERRTRYGIKLYQQHEAPRLLFSGGLCHSGYCEAIVMRQLAVDCGVPDADIITEELSIDTMENAVNCSIIIKENGWRKAIIVTDSYHLFRSLFVFRQLGIDVEGKSPTEGRGVTARSEWIFYHIREFVAFPWYMVRLGWRKLLTKKSFR